MSRMIDADDLLTAFPIGDEPTVTIACIRATIKHMPTIEPKIERCRDCQNYDGETCTRLLLRIDDIRCATYHPNDFGYCSLAERGTNETDSNLD